MKRRRPKILPFVILTVVTLLTWATLDVWRTFKNPAPIVIDESLLQEFNPNLGEDTISEIKGRIFFTDDQAKATILQRQPVPTPIADEGKISSPSGETQ